MSEPWETAISGTIDCLVRAIHQVEELAASALDRGAVEMPLNLASQCICTALVTLDDCRIDAETERTMTEQSMLVGAPEWRNWIAPPGA